MHFSTPMIELVIEIRRKVPSEFKPRVKLRSATLFNDLLEYYFTDCSTTVRALIKELFEQTGGTWLSAFDKKLAELESEAVANTMMYRGNDTATVEVPALVAERKKPVRMYRGQVVN